MNTYADPDVDLEKMLHGVARLHVHLGRMDESGISTRGWTYNNLVNGILLWSSEHVDSVVRMNRAIDTLFDTLEGIIEIGPNAINHLINIGDYLER